MPSAGECAQDLEKYNLDLFEGYIAVVDDHGGFDIVATDEYTAIEIFRQWWRRERLRWDREAMIERRRRGFRVVR